MVTWHRMLECKWKEKPIPIGDSLLYDVNTRAGWEVHPCGRWEVGGSLASGNIAPEGPEGCPHRSATWHRVSVPEQKHMHMAEVRVGKVLEPK